MSVSVLNSVALHTSSRFGWAMHVRLPWAMLPYGWGTVDVCKHCRQCALPTAACPPEALSGCCDAAVDAAQFEPDPSQRPGDRIVVVVLCRLVYRKGMDLLAVLLPEACRRYPHVDFLIGNHLHPKEQCHPQQQRSPVAVLCAPCCGRWCAWCLLDRSFQQVQASHIPREATRPAATARTRCPFKEALNQT
jgi:hypothetical protein